MGSRKGFTLIEILIVVSIIGILSSTVLVAVPKIRERGNDARRVTDLRSVQQAVELYYQACNYYPGTAQNGGCGDRTNIGTWPELTDAIVGSGIEKNIPNDPAGRDYLYGSDGFGYVLGARLGDRSNPNLRNDVDGTVYGVDCADPVYCIEF
jgi:general secretion pathway protein G